MCMYMYVGSMYTCVVIYTPNSVGAEFAGVRGKLAVDVNSPVGGESLALFPKHSQ